MNANIKTHYKKEELRKGLKQNLFYYKVTPSNNKRGYNREIKVFMIINKDFSPLCIGYADVNTSSFRGDTATANNIICEIFNYKTDDYFILDNRVKVYEIF